MQVFEKKNCFSTYLKLDHLLTNLPHSYPFTSFLRSQKRLMVSESDPLLHCCVVVKNTLIEGPCCSNMELSIGEGVWYMG